MVKMAAKARGIADSQWIITSVRIPYVHKGDRKKARILRWGFFWSSSSIKNSVCCPCNRIFNLIRAVSSHCQPPQTLEFVYSVVANCITNTFVHVNLEHKVNPHQLSPNLLYQRSHKSKDCVCGWLNGWLPLSLIPSRLLQVTFWGEIFHLNSLLAVPYTLLIIFDPLRL